MNGSDAGSGVAHEHYVISAGDTGSSRVNVSGGQIIGVTAGTHTLALKTTNTVSLGGGWTSAQMLTGSWVGLVIPQ